MSSAKRTATTDLNHENWDKEEATEDPGVFAQADSQTLKERVIKRAKRKVNADGETESVAKTPSLFAGFTGFKPPAADNKPLFAFNKTSTNSTESKPAFSGFSGFGASKTTDKSESSVTETSQTSELGSTQTNDTSTSNKLNRTKFLGSLKTLNESFLKWLEKHLSENPYCYFTPVFSDYSKHLAQLQSKYQFDDGDTADEAQTTSESNSAITETLSSQTVTPSKPAPSFNFGTTEKITSTDTKTEPQKPAFSFGAASATVTPSSGNTDAVQPLIFGNKSSSDNSPTKPLFSFSTKPANSETTDKSPNKTVTTSALGSLTAATSSETSKPAPTFSFGSSKPAENTDTPAPMFSFKPANSTSTPVPSFSFKDAVKSSQPSQESAATAEDEEYEPPKNEVENVINEDDALYTKRCKLFYEKAGKYVDRGVGNLFIKPLDSGKNSLLIRADTNLGNILLNIVLVDGLPFDRTGKNNVSLVCKPNPPIDEKDPDRLTPLLIRVKTSEDADELRDKLLEHRK